MNYGMTVSGFVLVLACLILIHCVSVLVFHGRRLTENVTPLRKTSPFFMKYLFSNIWDTGGSLIHFIGHMSPEGGQDILLDFN